MTMPLIRALCLVTPLIALAACGEDTPVAAPKPIELTRSDVGHYCRMIVVDHKGPKGQIHIKGQAKPVFFSSVRDAIAFTMLPEEPKRITAIYVNDMTKANWDNPGPGTWIKAREAHFVIGSSRRGGMGAAEAVPFAGNEAAVAFAAKYGGRVVRFKGIPKDYVLGPAGTAPSYAGRPAGGTQHGDAHKDASPAKGGDKHHHGHGNAKPPAAGHGDHKKHSAPNDAKGQHDKH